MTSLPVPFRYFLAMALWAQTPVLAGPTDSAPVSPPSVPEVLDERKIMDDIHRKRWNLLSECCNLLAESVKSTTSVEIVELGRVLEGETPSLYRDPSPDTELPWIRPV